MQKVSKFQLKYPLRNIVYEKMKQQDNATDKELLAELQRDGEDVSMRDLNKVLMQLEILGLVTLRWQTKDTRRIELVKAGQAKLSRVPSE
jgi:Fe2+ or Zn2+ uptake regulation protein